MNLRELGKNASDAIRGKEVIGTVSAVLRPKIELSQRYVVQTQDELLDVHLMDLENKKSGRFYYQPNEALKVGDKIHKRVRKVSVWTNGQ